MAIPPFYHLPALLQDHLSMFDFAADFKQRRGFVTDFVLDSCKVLFQIRRIDSHPLWKFEENFIPRHKKVYFPGLNRSLPNKTEFPMRDGNIYIFQRDRKSVV